MSRVGRLLLWVKAPRSLRHFNALCRTPVQAQDRLLRQILEANADTEFGRHHGFGGVTSFKEFQERVPISTYEDLEAYITAEMNGRPNQLTKEPPVLFTTTSGTTGSRKYIPMTREGKRAKSHLTWLWFCGLYRDHPGIVGGRILSVVSPEVESYAPSGVPVGAESGHGYRTMPGPVKSMYTAPYPVFAIEDYEAKYYTLLRLAAGQDISCIATVNPSTVLLLGDRLAQHTEPIIRDVRDGSLSSQFSVPQELRGSLHLRPDPERARHLEWAAAAGGGVLRPGLAWPKLAAVGCWKGGTVGAYLAKFDTLFPQGPPVRDFGYYATELRGSVPLSDQGDAGVIAVGTNVLEFHPAGDDRAPEGRELLPVERLEEGQRYFVYVTNASGLYRYDMNDIVEVAGHYGQTPLIRFIQKGKGVVSFTGEKLYETQVIAAVDEALAALRGRYHFIAAVAELVDGTTPRLIFLTEFDDSIAEQDGSALVDRLDAALGDQNDEYRSKRKSLRYGAPIIRVIRPGEYDRYRRRMVETGQRADGQFKVLRLTSDTSFAAEFAADQDLVGGDRTSA
ncbi:MAG TPA: GH3 auxin-responsive promoter family protein [Propionibacteriaceae bacterium]|nr:GH3 auxin-responsive promoter family protein [Propionibacteriaceae bacterium]